jgi:hypothetical protein
LGAYPDGDPSVLLEPPTRIEQTVQARPVHDPHGVDSAACCHCVDHASMLAFAELALTGTAIFDLLVPTGLFNVDKFNYYLKN